MRLCVPPVCRVQESDSTCKRNAFLMLFNCAQDIAVGYYLEHVDEVQSFGDGFQLVVCASISPLINTHHTNTNTAPLSLAPLCTALHGRYEARCVPTHTTTISRTAFLGRDRYFLSRTQCYAHATLCLWFVSNPA